MATPLVVTRLRGVSQLYVELALLAVVLSVGLSILYAASSTSASFEGSTRLPRLSALYVDGYVVLVNWGSGVLEVRLVCLDGNYSEVLEVPPGVRTYRVGCSEVAVVCGDYVARAVRVL
jgi:hypothetical protein